jgi:hypothetical protein
MGDRIQRVAELTRYDPVPVSGAGPQRPTSVSMADGCFWGVTTDAKWPPAEARGHLSHRKFLRYRRTLGLRQVTLRLALEVRGKELLMPSPCEP